jgi:hypothetical protein
MASPSETVSKLIMIQYRMANMSRGRLCVWTIAYSLGKKPAGKKPAL